MRRTRPAPILLADDDVATLDGLTEFLAQFNYRVVTATNGQDAMNFLIDGLRPSLFIVDLAMPHVEGSELLKYVQSEPDLREIPVLVVTGSPERLGRAVADVVLQKPVNLLSFLTHVRDLTSGHRRRAGDGTVTSHG